MRNDLLTDREFLGDEFFKFCQKEYEEARRFLKKCGRPKDEYDMWLIQFNKDTERVFSRWL